MSYLSGFAASGYRRSSGHSSPGMLTRWALGVSLGWLILLPAGITVALVLVASASGALPPSSSVAGMALPWLAVAVLSASRRVAILSTTAGFSGVMLLLTLWGGAEPGLTLFAWSMACLYAVGLLLTVRWGRVDAAPVSVVLAVLVASLFAGGAVVAPSFLLWCVAAALTALVVSSAVVMPKLLYGLAYLRARLLGDRESFQWDRIEPDVPSQGARGGHVDFAAVEQQLASLPDGFTVLRAVQPDKQMEPIDFVVVGRSGLFIVSPVVCRAEPTVEDRMFQLPGVDTDVVFSRLAHQRDALARRLGMTVEHVTCLLPIHAPGGGRFRFTAAYRPEVAGPYVQGDRATVLPVAGLAREIDSPLRGMSQSRADAVAAKVAAVCRPAGRLPVAAGSPTWMQVGYLLPDGDIQWGLRDRSSSSPVTVPVDPGARVNVTSARTRDGYRVVAAPTPYGSTLYVPICLEKDYKKHVRNRRINVYSVPLNEVEPYRLPVG